MALENWMSGCCLDTTHQLSLLCVCDLVKMLQPQDGFSFTPPVTHYDVTVDIETKVEMIMSCVLFSYKICPYLENILHYEEGFFFFFERMNTASCLFSALSMCTTV